MALYLKTFATTSLFICLIALSVFTTGAQNIKEWPMFHGLDRTNKSSETGLLKEWPVNGPAMLWSVSGLDFLTGKEVWKSDGKVCTGHTLLYATDDCMFAMPISFMRTI